MSFVGKNKKIFSVFSTYWFCVLRPRHSHPAIPDSLSLSALYLNLLLTICYIANKNSIKYYLVTLNLKQKSCYISRNDLIFYYLKYWCGMMVTTISVSCSLNIDWGKSCNINCMGKAFQLINTECLGAL